MSDDQAERIATALERIAESLEGMKAEPDPLVQMMDQWTGLLSAALWMNPLTRPQ